ELFALTTSSSIVNQTLVNLRVATSEVPKNPPNDWWIGYNDESEQISTVRPITASLHLDNVRYMMSSLTGNREVATMLYHELRTTCF
ncbi:hypothetical protein HAX54_000279, partial [Datura stramonium]|nr:hypothetical protein [Datura stramonium]